MAFCPSKAWGQYRMEQGVPCEVCGKHTDNCECPECPECGAVGASGCYSGSHGLKPAQDSIQGFCDHIGIWPVSQALRAIDKYNIEHVWLVLPDGERVYYHHTSRLQELDNQPWLRLKAVGVGGIAWDGSDWEYGNECPPDWAQLDALREDFEDALGAYEYEEG